MFVVQSKQNNYDMKKTKQLIIVVVIYVNIDLQDCVSKSRGESEKGLSTSIHISLTPFSLSSLD